MLSLSSQVSLIFSTCLRKRHPAKRYFMGKYFSSHYQYIFRLWTESIFLKPDYSAIHRIMLVIQIVHRKFQSSLSKKYIKWILINEIIFIKKCLSLPLTFRKKSAKYVAKWIYTSLLSILVYFILRFTLTTKFLYFSAQIYFAWITKCD